MRLQDLNLVVRSAEEKNTGQVLYVQASKHNSSTRRNDCGDVQWLFNHKTTKKRSPCCGSATSGRTRSGRLTTDKATAAHFICKANFYLWGNENEITRIIVINVAFTISPRTTCRDVHATKLCITTYKWFILLEFPLDIPLGVLSHYIQVVLTITINI